MSGAFSKFVFSGIVMVLAVFAAMPRHIVTQYVPTESAQVAPSAELRLAKAIHARINVEAEGQVPTEQLYQLAAEEIGLRQLAFADDADGARVELIDSLANELSAAMLQRSEIAARAGENAPEQRKMEEVVRALTAAINAEVRGASA